MREIKFRGMGINGEWYYGNLSIIKQRIKSMGIDPGSYISNKAGVPFAYKVRPETVGQFTGLEDKNGKGIYEGDCYTAKHKSGKVYTGQVKYDLSFVFDIEGFEELFINGVGAVKTNRTFDIHSFIKWFDEVEVIGNIYEDPELQEASHASK
ncbi:YopX family protein [Bacillus halotolerans]|uniref:YopX family protein n=1 Tax=Bacillus halotolerans TaxID=260554 RepID=UPI00298EE556|nr:YopX family protein [Bacillus halotolerans]WPC79756.1 YopX family protein [Bacillus halotolerans]